MTIAEQFASRHATLHKDRKDPAYDDAAVRRFEEDIYEAAQMIPVDPEDGHCTEHLFVFSDGSGIVGGDCAVAPPDTVKEFQELQCKWEEFQKDWFFDHPSCDRCSAFDRRECAEEFRKSVLDVSDDSS